jgi:hypothetical protein
MDLKTRELGEKKDGCDNKDLAMWCQDDCEYQNSFFCTSSKVSIPSTELPFLKYFPIASLVGCERVAPWVWFLMCEPIYTVNHEIFVALKFKSCLFLNPPLNSAFAIKTLIL